MIRPVLFVAFASYLDDANGGAVVSRAVMEALARRGFGAEVLCGPIRELNREIDLASTLAAQGLSLHVGIFRTGTASPDYLRLDLNGVPITVLAGSRLPRAR